VIDAEAPRRDSSITNWHFHPVIDIRMISMNYGDSRDQLRQIVTLYQGSEVYLSSRSMWSYQLNNEPVLASHFNDSVPVIHIPFDDFEINPKPNDWKIVERMVGTMLLSGGN
jgi:hypothetical protein